MIQIGRLGRLSIEPGFYGYAGSAAGPGGLAARLAHHLRPAVSPHWHIDYLKAHAPVDRIWISSDPAVLEHHWAGALLQAGGSIPLARFGASDCSCPSHLFYYRRRPSPAIVPWAVDVQP